MGRSGAPRYGNCRFCGNRCTMSAAPWKTLRVFHSSHSAYDDES